MQLKNEFDEETGEWELKMYCDTGYMFYNEDQPLVYTCSDGEDFSNANLGTYVPDCVCEYSYIYMHTGTYMVNI